MKQNEQQHTTHPLPATWKLNRTILNKLGFNTILGRFLLMAFVLIAATVTFAWLSQQKVKTTAQLNTRNQTDRVSINRNLRELSNLLWQTEMNFQNYMLVPSVEGKQQVMHDISQIRFRIASLDNESWVRENSSVYTATQQLAADAAAMHVQLTRITELRADPLKVFPYIQIMANELNPLNVEFNGDINIAINEAPSEITRRPQQAQVKDLFSELRYLWSQRINSFRLLSSNRVGLFIISSESGLRDTITDISAYENQINAQFMQLQELDRQGSLGFEQSASLAELIRIHSHWNRNYEDAKSIILSKDGWRTDTPILRDQINPLFIHLWEELRTLLQQIEQRATEDINSTTAVADQVSGQLWLLALLVCIVTLFGTLVFETQIRRPILRVIRALKAEAAGNTNIVLPESNIAEAHDLSLAFTHMREQIHNRQEHLQAILTYSAEAILTVNEDISIESFNPAAEKLFGYTTNEIIGKHINTLIPKSHHTSHNEYINQLLNDKNKNFLGKMRELSAQHKDGCQIEIILQITEMYVGGKRLFLALAADNRERRSMLEAIRAREQRLHSILDNTAEGIVTFDEEGRIETWNHAAEQLFGWNEVDVIGTTFMQFASSEIHNSHEPTDIETLRSILQHYLGRESEVVGHHNDGTRFPLSVKVSQMLLDGKLKYTALIANITERKAMMENLRKLAEHDSLTGLFNRAYFHAELERLVERVKRNENSPAALLYIDLDNFKYVNDTLGHAAGDKLLVEVAHILNSRTRRSDLVARLGGDEFVVLLAEAKPEIIQPIAESFRRQLADYAFRFDGRAVDIGCSIGVAMINSITQSPGEVLSQADVACHLAKRGGRNRIHLFTDKNDRDVHTMSIEMGWSTRIKQALEHDRFLLAFQPIVNTRTRETSLYEVLVRMRDEDEAIIMPGGFLPTAERFGLAVEIDAWVIRHAIAYLTSLHRRGHKLRFSINLSGQSINTVKIAELIPALLAENQLDPAALTFEITETLAIADMNMAVALMTQLRQLGCRTALDDFGSGMSSFAYLQELPVDIVKIDGRFVKNIANSSIDQAMVKAMNDIAHALKKETVAEFVENENHFQVLCQLGVDYGQGYHLGRPRLMDVFNAQLLQQSDDSSAASA